MPGLRSLDERVLPALADGVVRIGRGARRLRGVLVVVVIAVVTVTAASLWRLHQQPVGDRTLGEVVRVGVPDGGSIPAYEQHTRTSLRALSTTGPVYALVALRAYLAPDRLAPVLGGASVFEVYARVPLPGLQSQIVQIPAYRVPADVTAGMQEVADRKAKEAADYARRVAAVPGDSPAHRQMRDVYSTEQQIATAEAAAYREHCSCVYAAVVSADPTVLRGLAGRPEVRTVDPAPGVRRLDRAVFLPPLPEEHGVAGPPDAVDAPVTPSSAAPSAQPRASLGAPPR